MTGLDYATRAHELYVEENEERLIIENSSLNEERFLDRLSSQQRVIYEALKQDPPKKGDPRKQWRKLENAVEGGEFEEALEALDFLSEDALF